MNQQIKWLQPAEIPKISRSDKYLQILGGSMGTDIIVDPETTAEVLRNIAEKMQKESEEPGDLMDYAIVQQAAGIIEHLIPCRLCKHYQYELCMEGHKPTDDEFFCKDSKRDPKRELKRESKGD